MRKVFFMICAVLSPLFSLYAAAPNLLSNGDFATGDTTGWKRGNYNNAKSSWAVMNGVCTINVLAVGTSLTSNPGGDTSWNLQLIHLWDMQLSANTSYTFSFDASAVTSGRISATVKSYGSSAPVYFTNNAVMLTTTKQTFSFPFSMTADDPQAQVTFAYAGLKKNNSWSLSNVSVVSTGAVPVISKPFDRANLDVAQLTSQGVKINLVKPAQAEMKLYNLSGALIADYSSILKASFAGLNTISLNNRQVSNGLYLLKINTGARTVSLPLSVTR